MIKKLIVMMISVILFFEDGFIYLQASWFLMPPQVPINLGTVQETDNNKIRKIERISKALESRRHIPQDTYNEYARYLAGCITSDNNDVRKPALDALKMLFDKDYEIPADIVDDCLEKLSRLLVSTEHFVGQKALDAIESLFNNPREISSDIIKDRSKELVEMLNIPRDNKVIGHKRVSWALIYMFTGPRKIPSRIINSRAKKLIPLIYFESYGALIDVIIIVYTVLTAQADLSQHIINERLKDIAQSLQYGGYVRPESTSFLLGRIVRECKTLPLEVKEAIKKYVGLRSIEFRDGGNNTNLASFFAQGLLSGVKRDDMHLAEPPSGMPVKKTVQKDSISQASLKNIMPDDYTFLRAQGRTLIYERNDHKKYLALKLLKNGEDPSELLYESEFFDYIDDNKKVFNLKGTYPVSRQVNGNRIVKVRSIGVNAEEALKAQTDKEGSQIAVNRTNGYYTVMAYEVADKDYFVYLNDRSIKPEKFKEAMLKNMHDLFTLARFGIIHTSLIELFHNIEDRREYHWMVDSLIAGQGGRFGAGRLDAWLKSVKYPNLRLSCCADFAHFTHISRLAEEKRLCKVNPPYGIESKGIIEYSEEIFNFEELLGNYTLAATLITGAYFRERDMLNWERPHAYGLARFMQKCFETGYTAFTERTMDDAQIISDTVTWERFARQMGFYMAKGDPYAEPLMEYEIPRGIFEENVRLVIQGVRSGRNWINIQGRRGWYLDGINQDLGPMNGPLPIQKLIKANYIFTSFMIADRIKTKAILPHGTACSITPVRTETSRCH